MQPDEQLHGVGIPQASIAGEDGPKGSERVAMAMCDCMLDMQILMEQHLKVHQGLAAPCVCSYCIWLPACCPQQGQGSCGFMFNMQEAVCRQPLQAACTACQQHVLEPSADPPVLRNEVIEFNVRTDVSDSIQPAPPNNSFWSWRLHQLVNVHLSLAFQSSSKNTSLENTLCLGRPKR